MLLSLLLPPMLLPLLLVGSRPLPLQLGSRQEVQILLSLLLPPMLLLLVLVRSRPLPLQLGSRQLSLLQPPMMLLLLLVLLLVGSRPLPLELGSRPLPLELGSRQEVQILRSLLLPPMLLPLLLVRSHRRLRRAEETMERSKQVPAEELICRSNVRCKEWEFGIPECWKVIGIALLLRICRRPRRGSHLCNSDRNPQQNRIRRTHTTTIESENLSVGPRSQLHHRQPDRRRVNKTRLCPV